MTAADALSLLRDEAARLGAVARDVRDCSAAWEPGARLIGNVTAADLVALAAVVPLIERLAHWCGVEIVPELSHDKEGTEFWRFRRAYEDALRRLLADVRDVRGHIQQGGGINTLAYLADWERLALDGLAGEANVPRSPWRLAPSEWACTHESDCDEAARWSDGADQGACEKHAKDMGVFEPAEEGQP